MHTSLQLITAFLGLIPWQLLVIKSDTVTLTGDALLVISDADRFNNSALNLTIEDVMIDFYHVLGLVPLIISPNETIDVPCPQNKNFISRIYFGTFYNTPELSNYINISDCYLGTE